MAQKAKPAPANKSSSDPAIVELQRQLKQQGFFPDEIDGLAGEKTTKAIERRDAKAAADREAQQRDKQLEIETLKAQSGKATSDAQAAAAATETERKQRYNEQAGSGPGMLAEALADTVAPIAGVGVGRAMGGGINAWMDKSQASKNAMLSGVAADRTAGLTTRDAAQAAAARSGALPSGNSVARVGGRMLPHFLLGGIMAGKGGTILANRKEDAPFYPDTLAKAAALGMIGAGSGMAERGVAYGMAPGVAPDARAMAVIGSNQLRRPGALAQALTGEAAPGAPSATAGRPPAVEAPAPPTEAPAPTPGSKAHMLSQAKELEIKGATRMTKPELAAALSDAMATNAGKRVRAPKLPGGSGAAAIGATLGYALTPDRADAATGEPTGNTSEALTNAAVAGGTAYGASQGIGKLAQALSPAVKAAGAAGLEMAPTSMIDAMTEFSPEEQDAATHWFSRNLPLWMQTQRQREAGEMSTVPERNPVRSQLADMLLQRGAQ